MRASDRPVRLRLSPAPAWLRVGEKTPAAAGDLLSQTTPSSVRVFSWLMVLSVPSLSALCQGGACPPSELRLPEGAAAREVHVRLLLRARAKQATGCCALAHVQVAPFMEWDEHEHEDVACDQEPLPTDHVEVGAVDVSEFDNVAVAEDSKGADALLTADMDWTASIQEPPPASTMGETLLVAPDPAETAVVKRSGKKKKVKSKTGKKSSTAASLSGLGDNGDEASPAASSRNPLELDGVDTTAQLNPATIKHSKLNPILDNTLQ